MYSVVSQYMVYMVYMVYNCVYYCMCIYISLPEGVVGQQGDAELVLVMCEITSIWTCAGFIDWLGGWVLQAKPVQDVVYGPL
jgi:hypothetical protein